MKDDDQLDAHVTENGQTLSHGWSLENVCNSELPR